MGLKFMTDLAWIYASETTLGTEADSGRSVERQPKVS